MFHYWYYYCCYCKCYCYRYRYFFELHKFFIFYIVKSFPFLVFFTNPIINIITFFLNVWGIFFWRGDCLKKYSSLILILHNAHVFVYIPCYFILSISSSCLSLFSKLILISRNWKRNVMWPSRLSWRYLIQNSTFIWSVM